MQKNCQNFKNRKCIVISERPSYAWFNNFFTQDLKMCEYMLPHGDKRFQCQGWLLNSFTMHEKWKWDITIKQTRHTYCKCQSFQNKCSVKSAKNKGVKQRDYFLLMSMDVANTFFRCNEICFQILTRIVSHLMY